MTLSRPVEVLDESVIRWIEGRILREDVITQALAEVRRRIKERAEQPSEVPELEAREVQLNREIQRLGEALSTDQPLATITSMLSDKEVQLKDARARIANLKALPSMIDLEDSSA